jgi:hypothetical protein
MHILSHFANPLGKLKLRKSTCSIISRSRPGEEVRVNSGVAFLSGWAPQCKYDLMTLPKSLRDVGAVIIDTL